MGCRSHFGWSRFYVVVVDCEPEPMDSVHAAVDMFYGFFYRKIIPKILKIPQLVEFYI
jgi:hypothetical protein